MVPIWLDPPASGPAVLYAWDTGAGAALVSEGPAVLGSVPVTVLPTTSASAARVAKGGSSSLRLEK